MDADRISALPDEIIHNHILYRMDAPARMCLLSRRWLQLWRSYPVLEFRRREAHDDDFAAGLAAARRLSMYYEKCRTPLDSFRISAPGVDKELFQTLVASALTSDYGSPLEVAINAGPLHLLPEGFLSTCCRTRALKLSGCGLDGGLLLQPTPRLPKLQRLSLRGVALDDAQILYGFVANAAPKLESLSLEKCSLGFKKLEISAPRLNLKVATGFTQSHLDDVIAKLPCLESLCLTIAQDFRFAASMEIMRVSICGLRVFRLCDRHLPSSWSDRMSELQLDSPNLVSVHIVTASRLPNKIHVVNVSPDCRFVLQGDGLANGPWFSRLREFLSALNGFHVVVQWKLSQKLKKVSFDWSGTPARYAIHHLQLDFGGMPRPPYAQQSVSTFLDGFFWVCRPKFLSIIQAAEEETVKEQFDEHANCCVGGKCWRHELKIESVAEEVNGVATDDKDPPPTTNHVIKTCFALTYGANFSVKHAFGSLFRILFYLITLQIIVSLELD